MIAVRESEDETLNLPLWSSLNSMGSSSSNSSAYTSASKQLNGSSTTVRLPELKSTEHHGETASLVLICLSTSSRCFFPKLWTGLHWSCVSIQRNKETETGDGRTLIRSHSNISPAVSEVKTLLLSLSSLCFTRPNWPSIVSIGKL